MYANEYELELRAGSSIGRQYVPVPKRSRPGASPTTAACGITRASMIYYAWMIRVDDSTSYAYVGWGWMVWYSSIEEYDLVVRIPLSASMRDVGMVSEVYSSRPSWTPPMPCCCEKMIFTIILFTLTKIRCFYLI